MNIRVNASLWISVFDFFLIIYPEVGLLGPMIVLFSVFWGTFILFSIVATPRCICTNRAVGFPFLRTFSSTDQLCSFWWWPFWQVWGDNLGFDLHFPEGEDAEHLFHVLVGRCMSSLLKCLFSSSAHFSIGFFSFFFLYWVVWDVYMCWILAS